MKAHENTSRDPTDRMSRGIYRELGKLGWRTPQTDAEVRAAEEELVRSPGALPERLDRVPDPDPSEARDADHGLLSKYLQDDGRGSEADRQPEADRPSPELGR
jgi:hypothetical protein